MNNMQLERRLLEVERELRILKVRMAQEHAYKNLELISETEAARLAGFSKDTLKKWRLHNVTPPHVYTRVNQGRNIRYYRKPFEEWVVSDERIIQA